MAAVVCSTFLVAWMPYATVSLISALIPRDDQEAQNTVVEESTAMASHFPKILDVPSLLNWTATEYYRQMHYSYNPEEKWGHVANVNIHSGLNGSTFSSTLGMEAESKARSPQLLSCLPPVVTLIPAMFAKSHCMMNPFIYQIMNREFRDDIYVMVFGREKAERRRAQKRSLYERSIISLSYSQDWRRKRSNSLSVGRRNISSGGRAGPWVESGAEEADVLDFASSDTWKKAGEDLTRSSAKTPGDHILTAGQVFPLHSDHKPVTLTPLTSPSLRSEPCGFQPAVPKFTITPSENMATSQSTAHKQLTDQRSSSRVFTVAVLFQSRSTFLRLRSHLVAGTSVTR
ncbi:hypothetical protein INR49_001651 [Caranx melampygus]|nr:hypothetical protein INR49_001651 [Caranx melampygus]